MSIRKSFLGLCVASMVSLVAVGSAQAEPAEPASDTTPTDAPPADASATVAPPADAPPADAPATVAPPADAPPADAPPADAPPDDAPAQTAPSGVALGTNFEDARGARNARPASSYNSVGLTFGYDKGSIGEVGVNSALLILDAQICHATPKAAGHTDEASIAELGREAKDWVADILGLRACYMIKIPLKLGGDAPFDEAGVGNLAFGVAAHFDLGDVQFRIAPEIAISPSDAAGLATSSPLLGRYFTPGHHHIAALTSLAVHTDILDVRADFDFGLVFDNDSIFQLEYNFLNFGLTVRRGIIPMLSATLGFDYVTQFGGEQAPDADGSFLLSPGVRFDMPQVEVGLTIPLLLSADEAYKEFYEFGLLLDASYTF
ncbi:MAG: hypothetical protein ACI9MR_001127 [Myxococcota bacterium]